MTSSRNKTDAPVDPSRHTRSVDVRASRSGDSAMTRRVNAVTKELLTLIVNGRG